MAAKKTPFDAAFKLFSDKQFKKAAASFEKILADESLELGTKVAVTKYLNICNKQLGDSKETGDENSLAFVSYYMNVGEFGKARDILANIETTKGTADYLLAEMAIEEDENEEKACEHLAKAVEANADFRGYALNSIVFAPFLSKESFGFLHAGQNPGS